MANYSYKRFYLKFVTVTVSTGQTTGSSATDLEIKDGQIIGYYPTTNQDQLVDTVSISSTTGSVTVTLAASATADNVFSVSVIVRK